MAVAEQVPFVGAFGREETEDLLRGASIIKRVSVMFLTSCLSGRDDFDETYRISLWAGND